MDLSMDSWEAKAMFGLSEFKVTLRINNAGLDNIEPRPEDLEAVLASLKTMVSNLAPNEDSVVTLYNKYIPPTPQSF